METNFTDYINTVIRILILLDAVKDRKSIEMTETKIKLCDYYLKFPCTMFGQNKEEKNEWNFDEYYAFFHWHPNLLQYRQCLAYLQAKCFAEKKLENNKLCYKITDTGIEALYSIRNDYKDRMERQAKNAIIEIAGFSDKKIEKIISEKSKQGIKEERSVARET